MFSFKSIVLIAAAFALAECSEVAVPAAPLTVPAHVGYAHAIPQNIQPFAAQVSQVNRAVAAPFAAPIAAPFAASFAAPIAAPIAARYATPFAPAPYFAGPAPFAPVPAPYALPPAAYAAPFPYAAPYPFAGPAPYLRTAFGVAPAFVR